MFLVNKDKESDEKIIKSFPPNHVIATADGQVIEEVQDSSVNLKLIIQHPNEIYTEYNHLTSSKVKVGDIVKRGQKIAVYHGQIPDVRFYRRIKDFREC